METTHPNVHSKEIEKLKRVIRKLKAENFKLHSIIEDLPGSIYWKDKAGVYRGRNRTSAESLRNMNFIWKLEDIIGKTDYDLFTKEMADGFRSHDKEVMDSGIESTKEELAILPSGEEVIQLSTKRPLYDERGNVVGVVGNTVDITYLKKIEAELREAHEKAEEANKIKTAFIHNMEHDIRTPLSGIWGMVNQLHQREIDPFKKEHLDDVTHCAKELLDYCNGILDFSKIELGTLSRLEKKFNIKNLVKNVIAIETPPAKIKNLDLMLEFNGNIPDVLVGDEYRLERILINLVSNAIKFTQQGYVKIFVNFVDKLSKNQVIISFIIKDSGIGIPQEKQDFIYEKFTRLSPSNKGIYKGIGLGLRIVKKFIEDMEGEIELKSELGKGSIFICNLPFKLPLVSQRIEDVF